MHITMTKVDMISCDGVQSYWNIFNDGRIIAVVYEEDSAMAAFNLLSTLREDARRDSIEYDPADDGPEVDIIKRERQYENE